VHPTGSGVGATATTRVLDAYADAGGNFVDTADYYTNGASERLLGELLHDRRDRFVLATKYTMQTQSGDLNSAGNHRKNLVTSLEASLRRLRTDYIDLYWVHARDVLTPVDEVMRALDDQVRAGKILHVGVSGRLETESAVPLGFPHDFLRAESIKDIVYGSERDLVDDRRLSVRRAVPDGPNATAATSR
jgi:aryl-alcohol dehydrogenase-like predicted oxidoreductase